MRSASLLLVLAGIALGACSSDDELFGTSEAASASSGGAVCAPGQQIECACSGDGTGTQVCSADGKGFGPCSCDGPGGGGQGGNGGGGASGGEGGGRRVCEPGSTTECYTGPAGTSGKGLCVPGIATCERDGSAWGPCEGEVTPQPETCSTPGDDDCDGQTNEDGANCDCSPGSQSDCYSGPPTTEGVGPCHGGVQQCNAMGTGFGPCVGEVVPSAETCNTPVDDDCDDMTNEDGAGCVCVPNATTTCYDGPPGTENVGVCKPGMHTCNDQGTAFGPCNGQMLPSPDLCATAADDDCSGSPMPCELDPPWSKSFPGTTGPMDLAIDGAGNIIIAVYGNNVDFGGGPVPGNFYVVKLDPQGNHLWSKGYPVDGYDIHVDSNGNVLIVGRFSGLVDFGGGGVFSATQAVFVVKLDASGNHVWTKAFTAAANGNGSYGRSVATDSTGASYVGGRIGATVDFGGGPLSPTGQSGDGFLLKLTSAGAHAWSKKLGSDNGGEVGSIAVDGLDNPVVTGSFNGTLALSGIPSAGGSNDIFVAKLDPGGATTWAKAFGDSGQQLYSWLALDPAGNVALTGSFEGKISFGGSQFMATTNQDVFVAKLDASGNHVWSRSLGNAQQQIPGGVAFDALANTYVVGSFSSIIDSGAGFLVSAGNTDVFVAKHGPSGTGIASSRYGDADLQNGHRVVVDALGAPVVLGGFAGSIDFGQGALTTNVGNEVFLAKLAP